MNIQSSPVKSSKVMLLTIAQWWQIVWHLQYSTVNVDARHITGHQTCQAQAVLLSPHQNRWVCQLKWEFRIDGFPARSCLHQLFSDLVGPEVGSTSPNPIWLSFMICNKSWGISLRPALSGKVALVHPTLFQTIILESCPKPKGFYMVIVTKCFASTHSLEEVSNQIDKCG